MWLFHVIITLLLMLFCVTTDANQRHDSVEERLKHLETLHKLGHRKLMSMERLVDTQGDIILDLVDTIEELKDASFRQKSHIVTLFKRARRYKRQIHDLSKTLSDHCPEDHRENMPEKQAPHQSPHHHTASGNKGHTSTDRTPADHSQGSQHGTGRTHHHQSSHHSHGNNQTQSAQTEREHHGGQPSHPHNPEQTTAEIPYTQGDLTRGPHHGNGHSGNHNTHTHHGNGTHHSNGQHGDGNHGSHNHNGGNSHHGTKPPQRQHSHAPHHDKPESTTKAPGHNRDHVNDKSHARRQLSGGIAFTAYLDHDMTLGGHQTLKFNKIITNEGNGYSNHTGVFTCVEAGVYMFTFFIGQRDANHYMWAELLVNSQNVIDAVVDTYHQSQDLQGGNTAIVRLHEGDRVWVDATHTGSHVEGSNSLRICSFSGLYLYP